MLCTHLHVDHVGWNTRLDNGRWVPTFPNARYVMARREFDHWQAVQQRGEDSPHRLAFEDSVLPVVRTGQAVLVDDDYALDDGFWFESAPGHTPGNVVIHARSRDDRAVFLGDILHHAVQVYDPEWNSFACLDQDNARKSRRAAIEHCAGSGALLMPCHFGAPFHCDIDHKGAGFAPRFANNF